MRFFFVYYLDGFHAANIYKTNTGAIFNITVTCDV